MLRFIKRLLGITGLEKQMDDLKQEIADIKAEVLAYQKAVSDKVAELEAHVNAGADTSELKAALDDLKATADSLVVPA